MVDLAEGEDSFWEAFTHLKKALGDGEYGGAIRSSLSSPNANNIPEIYEKLWGLGVTGFLTLNLDRFAARGFSRARSGDNLREFEGVNVNQNVDILRSATPFVANLHGVLDNQDSWIFTTEEFKNLTSQAGYATLIQTCFASRTILFMGISADDEAATGHLQRLKTLGLNPGNHFWLTDRTDQKADEWAGKIGLRQIIYKKVDSGFVEITQFIQDLCRYIPPEVVALPVTPSTRRERNLSIPPPEEVETKKANDIRILLNKEAVRILGSESPERFEEYKHFWARYREAIYRAWSVAANEPNNLLFEYKITGTLAKGSFGYVYEAKDMKDEHVAIKILHGMSPKSPK